MFKLAELDQSISILLKFMQHLAQMKEIIENGTSVEYYYENLTSYLNLFRNNVSYTFELLSNYTDSIYKTNYIITLTTINKMCNYLEDFLNFSLLNKMNFTESLETKLDNFIYDLGESLIKVGETLKLSKDLLK